MMPFASLAIRRCAWSGSILLVGACGKSDHARPQPDANAPSDVYQPDANAINNVYQPDASALNNVYSRTCNGAAVLKNPRTFPDGGACDDSTPIRLSPDAGKVTCQYAVNCDAQSPEKPGCRGLPNDIWGGNALRRCAGRVSYPEGCRVTLPTENPYYHGHGQPCACSSGPAGSKPTWVCGL